MNRAQRVLGIDELSSEGVTATQADPKLVFIAALKANACNIILSHNHLPGNFKPSRADEELTKNIVTAGIYLDIKVTDHIIVASEEYYSFADEGLI